VAFRMGPLAPTKVTVSQVTNESLTPSVFGIGSVEAKQSWLMGPTVAGRVLRVYVDVGQTVKSGQLLAEMDPVELEQRLRAQEAALAKASSVEVAAKAQVADTQARRELAHANLSRNKDLAKQNFISSAALEGREQEFQSADAAWHAAQANLQAAKQDAQRLQAERAAASLQRQNTRLVAPADAVVISRDAESGSTVVAGQPVIRLANPASLWVKLRVDQGRSLGLEAGLSANIVLRSRPQQVLMGKVERVELQADSVTEERIAQVAFDQIPPALSIGEMAEVTLNLQALTSAMVLPLASVKMHQGRTGVWRLKDGALEFVPVQWGLASLDGRIQVLQGLTANDTVVVYSDKPLSTGGRIRVVDALVKKGAP
jgi:HlyD family secretion protein